MITLTVDPCDPTVDVHDAEHWLASVTVTVYGPAARPLIDDVVADVLHK